MNREAALSLYNNTPRLGLTFQGWLYFENTAAQTMSLVCSPHQLQAPNSPWTAKLFKVPQAFDDFARQVNSKYWHPVDWPSESCMRDDYLLS